MNFFEHQDQARRQTGTLIALFSVAVVSIVIAVNLACWLAWLATEIYWGNTPPHWLSSWLLWWQSGYGLFVVGATLFLILVGSALQWFALSQGGPSVAAKVGARPVSDFRHDPQIEQYKNVVSEMAIASGMPVPQLFVLDRELGINAFVAGYQLNDTIMVVTRGLLDTLDRDQLQAVTGHEFSHIAQGDMRLNLRLMSLLSGIVMIGQFGLFLMDSQSHRRRSRSRQSKESNGLPIWVLGLVIWLIGNIGVFFARLIKAAVSRQREFLADAASVQFTRNPEGLAGALYQILQSKEGSVLQSRHKEAISHLCISTTTHGQHWLGNLQTHPPLETRIDRVAPGFRIKAKHRKQQQQLTEPDPATLPPQASGFVGGTSGGGQPLMTTQSILASVGTAQAAHLRVGQQLYRDIPEKLRVALQQTQGAQAFCVALIVRGAPDPISLLNGQTTLSSEGRDWLSKLLPWVKQMPERLRLPCLELCLPTLKTLSAEQRKGFIKDIESISTQDRRLDVQEWLVLSLLRITLFPRPSQRPAARAKDFSTVSPAIQTLLSALVHNDDDFAGAQQAYKKVVPSFNLSQQWLLSPDVVTYEAVSKALWQLGDLSFILRQPLLQACADIVLHDGLVTVTEFEFLRVVSATLECPMPPLTDSLH